MKKLLLVALVLGIGAWFVNDIHAQRYDALGDIVTRRDIVHWRNPYPRVYIDSTHVDSGDVDTSIWHPIDVGGGKYSLECCAIENPFRLDFRESAAAIGGTPDVTFSKTSDYLRMLSTAAGTGIAFAFKAFPKSYLDGKTVAVRWEHPAASADVISRLAIYDGSYDRHSDTDFPAADTLLSKGGGRLQFTEDENDITRTTTTLTASLSSSTQDFVTVFVWNMDNDGAAAGDLRIVWLKIVSSAGDTLQCSDIDDPCTTEQTGTTGDYGYIGTRPHLWLEYQLGHGVDTDADGSVSDEAFFTEPASGTIYEPMALGTDQSIFLPGTHPWFTIGEMYPSDGNYSIFPLTPDDPAEGIRFRATRSDTAAAGTYRQTPVQMWLRRKPQ